MAENKTKSWTPEHRQFHVQHGMPMQWYGACGKCQLRFEQAMTLLEVFESNTNPHVVPADVRAIITDSVLRRVDQDAIAGWMIEADQMHRTIKWLIDHLDECEFARLRQDDDTFLMLTSYDRIVTWLEDMSGVLGAEGYEAAEE